MRPDRGGVALTTLLAGLCLAAAAILVAGGVASLGEAAARARTAADAAALAGAATSPLVGGDGSDPCRAAADLAAANGATLVRCASAPAGGHPGPVLRLTAAVEPPLALPGLPDRVEAQAAAGVRPAPVP